MNKQWTFLLEDPWLWLLPLACLAVFVFCLIVELRKGRGPQSWLRVVLLLLAHIALLLAGLRPAYLQSLPPAKAILVQADARTAALDSLRAQHPEAAVYSLRHEQAAAEAANLPHASYLPQYLSPGSTVFLLGGGLDEEELRYLQPYELHFIPSEIPDGIRGLSYNSDLQLGDTLKVRSSASFGHDSLWLRLSLGGRGVDSLLIRGEDTQSFLLQARPPLAGMLEYRLDLLNTHFDTLENYPMLVRVRPNRAVKLALLTAYPGFEAKYLKNWLAAEGHAVYYQTEMAPGRYTREWLNMPEIKPHALNQELLQTVDIIIMDEAYWNQLSAGRIRELAAAVQNQGLGCLVLAESGLWRPSASGWTSLPDLQVSARRQVAPLSRDANEAGTLLSYYIAKPGKWLPLLSNAEEAPLLLFRPQGLGRVGVSLLESTYPLLLSEQDAAYSRLWTTILNAFVKPAVIPGAIEAGFPAFADRKNHLQFWQTGDEMQEVVLTEPNQREQVLPLVQDWQVPSLWHAYFWPRESGEHRLNIQGGDSLSFIVYQAEALPAIKGFKQARETYAVVGDNFKQGAAGMEVARAEVLHEHYKAVSLLWFYLLFLLSMAGLWIERKLRGQ